MTFEELEQKLPNGFHDAAIREINFDFIGRSVVVGMDILMGGPDKDPRGGWRNTVRRNVDQIDKLADNVANKHPCECRSLHSLIAPRTRRIGMIQEARRLTK